MGQRFFADTGAQTVSAAQDLLEILVPTDAAIKLSTVTVTQSTEAGDAMSEQLIMSIKRGNGSTSGSGGGTVTPGKVVQGGNASGCTVERNNTTQHTAGGGSLTTLYTECFNVMAGASYVELPDFQLEFSPGEYCVVSISAPGDPTDISAVAKWEEIGG